MKTARGSTNRSDMITNETSCGVFCQHPACWQSNTRKEKGFPLYIEKGFTERKPVVESSLPEMSVYNLIEDYGDDERDRFPAKCNTQPSEVRYNQLPALTYTDKSMGKYCSTPLVTPESVVRPAKKKSPPQVKVAEVQELFDVEDLESRWDETFITKQCYVWVPNPKKKPQVEHTEQEEPKMITEGSKSGNQPIPAKDVTEQLVPEEIEREREEQKMPFNTFPVLKYKKRQAARCRSPIGRSRGTAKYNSYSQRAAFDTDGINDLLNLPRDLLMQVLDHLNDSDLLSKDRINDVIHDFQPTLSRDITGISIGTAEALKQKKMDLLRDKKRNIRESHLMESRPVFQLDDAALIERMSRVNSGVHIDTGQDTPDLPLSIQGFSKNKKPLPAIEKAKIDKSSKESSKKKVVSVSLGLPELPTGIKHTKPFTYKKSEIMDLSIGPVPTPLTSDRSSVCCGSDHGTTINVNLTSPTDDRSSKRQGIDVRVPIITPTRPNSPSILPKAPVCTPATNQESSFTRDKTSTSLKHQMTSKDHSSSSLKAAVVTPPTNTEAQDNQDTTGLNTIPEVSAREDVEITSEQQKEVPQEETNYQIDSTPLNIPDDTNDSVGYTENESLAKTYRVSSGNECQDPEVAAIGVSTYSSPDPWPQVNEEMLAKDGEEGMDDSRLDNQKNSDRESEEYLARKIFEERRKGNSPAPPPPSPEGERLPNLKSMSRESGGMEALVEEEDEDFSETDASQAQVVTVSQVVPNPQGLTKEKSFHSFINVDIPAESADAGKEKSGDSLSERLKLGRAVQSFVSVDIPGSTAENELGVSNSDDKLKEDPQENNEETKGEDVGETEAVIQSQDAACEEAQDDTQEETAEDSVQQEIETAEEESDQRGTE